MNDSISGVKMGLQVSKSKFIEFFHPSKYSYILFCNDSILGAEGNVDMNLLNPLIFAGGNYYETGRLIRKLGEALKDVDCKPFVTNYNRDI